MTNITIKSYKNGKKYLKASGHSGYSSAGTDIVCAGISALTTSFCNVCIELEEEHKLQITKLTAMEGEIEIEVCDPFNNSMSAFRMLEIGLSAIQKNYSNFVNLCAEWEEITK